MWIGHIVLIKTWDNFIPKSYYQAVPVNSTTFISSTPSWHHCSPYSQRTSPEKYHEYYPVTMSNVLSKQEYQSFVPSTPTSRVFYDPVFLCEVNFTFSVTLLMNPKSSPSKDYLSTDNLIILSSFHHLILRQYFSVCTQQTITHHKSYFSPDFPSI